MKSSWPVASLVLCLALAGCSGKDETGQPSAKAPNPSSNKSELANMEPITLKLNVEKGFKAEVIGTIKVNADASEAANQPGIPEKDKVELSKPSEAMINMVGSFEVADVAGDQVRILLKNNVKDAQATGMLQGMLESLRSQFTQDLEFEVNRMRKVLKRIKGESGSNSVVVFPDHPVKVGDKWESEGMANGKAIQLQIVFEGIESVNGKECARLSISGADYSPMTSDGPEYEWVDVKTGLMVKKTMAISGTTNHVKMRFAAEIGYRY